MDSKIKKISVFTALSKEQRAISDATHNISEIRFFIVEVETYSGVTGQGYLLSFDYSLKAITGALQDIEPFIKDLNVYETGILEKTWLNQSEYFGSEGLLRWVFGIVNIAMWDAWGKILGKPIHQILGQSKYKIPIYGSGGWLSYSNNELVEEVLNYKTRGFRSVKIKVGSKDVEKDIERLTLVREKGGKDLNIMMDANQGMTLQNAIYLSNKVKKLNVLWFEEPINHLNYNGYKTLKNKTNISLAMGEREYNTEALKNLINMNAIDLWQPDIIRLGGVEAWLRSAALANEYHISVLPHYYKDYDVPLLATILNGFGAESFDWIDGIISNQMIVKDGYALLRDGAGWGFEFSKSHLEEI